MRSNEHRTALNNDNGRLVGQAAIDAVAIAGERLSEPEDSSLLGIEVTLVFETPAGTHTITHSASPPVR